MIEAIIGISFYIFMVADFAFSLWLSNKIEKDFGFPAIISLFPIMFAIMYVADGIINYFK